MRYVLGCMITVFCVVANAVVAQTPSHPLVDAATLRQARKAEKAPIVRLDYRVSELTAPNQRDRWSVDLGRRYVAVKRGQTIDLLDFALERRLLIDTATGMYINRSLHGELAGRRGELSNRYMLLSTLEAGGLANRAELNQMRIESAMGMAIPPLPRRPVKIERSVAEGIESFRHDSAEWARARYADGKSLDPDARTSYERFLRRAIVAIHPAIVDMLLESGRVVTWLVFQHAEPLGAERWVTLELIEQITAKADYPLAPEFRPQLGNPTGDDAKARGLNRVMRAASTALASPQGAKPLSAFRTDIVKLLQENRPLAAWVMVTETALQYGAQAVQECRTEPCPDMKRLRELIQSDPSVALMQQANALNTSDPARSVALFRQVPRHGLQNAYVLDLLQTNSLSRLKGNERAEAMGGYVAAIEANPYVGNFYKDLGDHLISDWDYITGWVMHDIGRALPRPANDNLTQVDAYEARMRREHPELY